LGTRAVAIFGGPGSGALIAESIAALVAGGQDLRLVGFLNDVLPIGAIISGVPVLGPFASWWNLPEKTTFLAPLHKAMAMPARVGRVEELKVPSHRWTSIIDPRAAVASDASIGHGCFIGPFASVGPAACIGAHTVIRAGAHVSHDCAIGSFVFVGTNAVICGRCTVHDAAYIAPSAVIRDDCQVGKFAVVGLGSVVTKDVPELVVAVGSPARPVRVGTVVDAV